MLTGFNTNVPYKGKMYHVQTEDGGARNPVFTTLLYHKGEILASEKSSYADLLIDENWEEKALERMKEQHRTVIRKLMKGGWSQDPDPAASGNGKEKSLEETIIDYIVGPEGQ
jgi:hypothetical protein